MDNWIFDVKCYALQCLCAIGVVIGIMVYRMSVRAALHLHEHPVIHNNAATIISVTAASMNVIAIFCLEFVSDLCPGTLLSCFS